MYPFCSPSALLTSIPSPMFLAPACDYHSLPYWACRDTSLLSCNVKLVWRAHNSHIAVANYIGVVELNGLCSYHFGRKPVVPIQCSPSFRFKMPGNLFREPLLIRIFVSKKEHQKMLGMLKLDNILKTKVFITWLLIFLISCHTGRYEKSQHGNDQ
jgi:hypothetical protein